MSKPTNNNTMAQSQIENIKKFREGFRVIYHEGVANIVHFKSNPDILKYKLYGHERQTCIETLYSEYQNFLYKRAMYGLSVYKAQELRKMHPAKKQRVQNLQKKAEDVLNKWRQEMINEMTNRVFSMFHQSKLANEIVKESFTDSEFQSTIKLKDLRITKEATVKRLIDTGVLPSNFYELDKSNVKLEKQTLHAR